MNEDRKRRRIGRVVTGLCLLAIGFAGAGWFYAYWSAGRTIARAEAALRAQGYPVTWAELSEWYKRPEGENAADWYEKAFLRMGEGPPVSRETQYVLPWFGYGAMPPPNEPIPEDVKQAMTECVLSHGAALAALMEGAKRPQAWYPIDFARGPATLLGHVPRVRDSVQLLAMTAILHADRNEPQQAVEGLSAAMRVCESLADEPLAVSQRTRSSGHELVLEALRQVLHRTRLSGDQMKALQDLCAETLARDTFNRAIAGETAMVSGALESREALPSLLGPPDRYTGLKVNALTLTGLHRFNRAHYVSAMREAVAASRLPMEERLAAARRCLQTENPHSYLALAEYQFVFLYRDFEINADDAARLRCAAAALAVERYRLAHGELPPSLDTLVPEYLQAVPLDPFDGQPLRYRLREDGYDVYSVSRNLADDHAATEEDEVFPIAK